MIEDKLYSEIHNIVSTLLYTEPRSPTKDSIEKMHKTLDYIDTFEKLEDIPDGVYDFGSILTGRGGAIEIVKAMNLENNESITIPGIGIKPINK